MVGINLIIKTNSMKYRILSIILAAALFAACSVNSEVIDNPESNVVEEFFATIEDELTRVFADDQLRVLWNADDRISIFNKYTYNQEYRFVGYDGDNSGSFTKVPNDDFVTGNTLDLIYAIYPYRESTRIDNDGVITVVLPAEQTYREDSFGLGANTMVSMTEDNLLLFKNLCGYLMFKLYGDDVTVTSISIRGNKNEPLAGEAFVNASVNGVPSMSFSDLATDVITLVFDNPVLLGATVETATTFWIVVPPTIFDEGFTMTVNDNKNNVFEKSTTKQFEIKRNELFRMSALNCQMTDNPDIVETLEAIDLGLPSGLLWASMNVGAQNPSDIGGRYAWGETETKSYYDWDNYKWCDGTYYSMTKYCTKSIYGTVDGKTVLEDEDDVAKVLLGNGWRMPTKDELSELLTECSWRSEIVNNVNGYLVTGPNGNSIFFPLNGQFDELGLTWPSSVYLWSSETTGDNNAYRLTYSSRDKDVSCSNHKHDGLCVRPVMSENVIDLSENGTSNCYIVNSSGQYKFNASFRGNSTESVGIPDEADILWESFNNNIEPKEGELIKDVKYSDGYVTFKATGISGNALIAVKDEKGTILWSWHIWLTDYNPEEGYCIYEGNDVKMMDRNLGALSITPGNVQAQGFYYQWGRKDPFPSSSSYPIFEMMATLPENVFSSSTCSSTTGTVEYSIMNPTVAITERSGDSHHDWLYNTNSTLWAKDKTKYDPCPVGWKVPEVSVYYPLTNTSDYTRDETNYAVFFGESVSTPSTFFPRNGNNPAGALSGGEFPNSCHYWTCSTMSTYYSHRFCVYEDSNPSINYISYRSHGFPVRCCKE